MSKYNMDRNFYKIRPGFGEFANVPGGIHYKSATNKQVVARQLNRNTI